MSDVTHGSHVLNSHDNHESLFSHIKYEQFSKFSLFEGISNNQEHFLKHKNIIKEQKFVLTINFFLDFRKSYNLIEFIYSISK